MDKRFDILLLKRFIRGAGSGLILFTAASFADEKDQKKSTVDDIDWNKPIVSRGFGRSSDIHSQDLDVKSQYQRGEIEYFFGNYKAAFELWLPLAEKGLASAQANCGWILQNGLGVPVDFLKSRRWYELAAKQQHAVALNNLGVLYEKGFGVDIDLDTAFTYYRRSAELNYRYAQFNIGRFFWDGLSVPKNRDQAKTWFNKAIAQGVTEAHTYLDTH